MRKQILLMLTGFSAAFIAAAATAEPLKMKVGFIVPLTGPASDLGGSVRNGFEMGLAKAGKNHLEVVFQDDEFQPRKSADAFEKLVDADKARIIVAMGSGASGAVAPKAEQRKVPLIACAGDDQVAKDRNNVVKLYHFVEDEGAATGAEAQRLGYTAVGVVVAQNDYALAQKQAFLAHFPPASLVFSEEAPLSASDFRSIFLRARNAGVKQLYICGISQAGLMARQAREIHFDGPIFGCGRIVTAYEVEQASGALKGAWAHLVKLDPAFVESFERRYPTTADIMIAAWFHELAIILSELAEKGTSPEEIIPAILNLGERHGAVSSYRFANRNGVRAAEAELAKQVVP